MAAAPGRHGCKSDCRFNDLYEELQSHRRIWVQVDYLSWWGKGNPLPPLVTTSPVGTPQDQAGVLPVSATTAILYGNERVDQQTRNGGRINFGYWLIDGEFLGIEGQFLQLGQQNSNFCDVHRADADHRPAIHERGPVIDRSHAGRRLGIVPRLRSRLGCRAT